MNSSRYIFKRSALLSLAAGLLLAACAPPTKVAVEERKTITARAEAERIGGNHIRFVAPGDTLHAIAFINGLNVNDLAAWNSVRDTGQLEVGQRIRLTQPLGFVRQKPPEQPVVVVEVEDVGEVVSKPLVDRTISTSPLEPVKSDNTGTSQDHSELPNNRTNAPLPENAQPAPSTKPLPSSKPDSPPTQIAQPPAKPQKLVWHWPTEGKVVLRFSGQTGQQGVDIQGQLGQAVLASGNGEVVYVGDGLKGYGNLVIIKHNEQFLSAYAHNQEAFVLEGQRVTAKQRIASLGQNNRKQNALHFQIRKDGQPVDPLKYISP